MQANCNISTGDSVNILTVNDHEYLNVLRYEDTLGNIPSEYTDFEDEPIEQMDGDESVVLLRSYVAPIGLQFKVDSLERITDDLGNLYFKILN